MAKKETVTAVLAEKFKEEKRRLKSYGTKSDSFSLAYAVTPYVMSLMTEARYEEVQSLLVLVKKKFTHPKRSIRIVKKWLKERNHDLDIGRKSIRNWAETLEKERPWRIASSLPQSEIPPERKSISSKGKKKLKKKVI